MKTTLRTLIRLASLGAITIIGTASAASGATYYVDSDPLVGNDTNAGTSPTTAWRNISRVNNNLLQAGDQVLFKKGGTWTGKLDVNYSGTATSPIYFGSYGTSSAKPLIQAKGTQVAAIYISPTANYNTIEGFSVSNCEGVVVNGVNPVYTGAEGERSGIMIGYSDTGILNGVKIIGNEIFNIEGYSNDIGTIARGKSAVGVNDHKYGNAGIYVRANSTNSLLVEGNYIRESSCAGIIIQTTADLLKSTNTLVQHNSVNNVGGDGMYLSNQANPLVQFNSCFNAGNNSGTAPQAYPVLGYNGTAFCGVWAKLCNSAVFQYNFCEGTKKVAYDGQAWDFDLSNTGVIVYQYNYSRNNEGGFILSTLDTTGVTKICRYNISVNDGTIRNGDGQGFFNGHATYYNNIFYRNDGKNFNMATYYTVVASGAFSNNIFYTAAATSMVTNYQEPGSGRTFTNNSFYGHTPLNPGSNSITSNPLLVNPSTTVTFSPGAYGITAAQIRTALAGFQVASNSPLLNTGATITSNGGLDFWGDTLYSGAPDIGADEFFLAPVVFSPAAGTYTSVQTVTLSSNTPGVTIRYTKDGSTPTATVGTTYTAPITVSTNTTLKAYAFKTGFSNTSVTSGAYTILVAAAPTFTPPAGTYITAQTVTLSSATSGATIRYTTNGTTPSATNGTTYTSPISISSSATLKAYASKSGLGNSSITTGIYTIQPYSDLSNGSFETSTTGWAVSSTNANPAAAATNAYQGSTGGTYALALGGGDAAGNAVISQAFPTVSGLRYALVFDYGAFGASGAAQRLLVEVRNGSTNLLSSNLIAYGPNSYNGSSTTFEGKIMFFTAASSSTTVRFTDQTTATDSIGCDGMLDMVGVRLVATVTNGSFENGVTNWTVTSRNANPASYLVNTWQGVTNGSYSLVLGAGDVAGNAIVSQSIATVSGTKYAVAFDLGAFGASGAPQQIRVEALNGTTVLDSFDVTAVGPNAYTGSSTVFKKYALDFNAVSASTTIRFTDLTTLTNSVGCDTVIDFVGGN